MHLDYSPLANCKRCATFRLPQGAQVLPRLYGLSTYLAVLAALVLSLLGTAAASTRHSQQMSPDGHYRVHQPTLPSLKLRAAFFFKAAYGLVRQSEYSTPYGPLIVTQHPTFQSSPLRGETHRRANLGASGPQPPAHLTTGDHGTTQIGAFWTLTHDGRRNRIDMDFPDSSLTIWLPMQPRLDIVRTLTESVR